MSIIKKCDVCTAVLLEENMTVQTQDFTPTPAPGEPVVVLRLQTGIADVAVGELCRACMVRTVIKAVDAFRAAHPDFV